MIHREFKEYDNNNIYDWVLAQPNLMYFAITIRQSIMNSQVAINN